VLDCVDGDLVGWLVRLLYVWYQSAPGSMLMVNIATTLSTNLQPPRSVAEVTPLYSVVFLCNFISGDVFYCYDSLVSPALDIIIKDIISVSDNSPIVVMYWFLISSNSNIFHVHLEEGGAWQDCVSPHMNSHFSETVQDKFTTE